MKRLLLLWFCLAPLLLAQVSPPTNSSQTEQPAPGGQQLTIESIFAEGGITGRAPETVKWSPDSKKVSFVQRDDSGEHGALYYVDVTSGKKAILVAEEKLATLAPPISKLKNEREHERIQRYSVASYQWAPDSKHLLFDSRGQLWLYSLDTGTAVQLTSAAEPSSDPKFSPDGKRIAYVRTNGLYVRSTDGGSERVLVRDKDAEILSGAVDWVYAEELDVRSNYFWSPNGKQIVFLQMNEKPVPTYPITDWIPTHPKVDEERYPKAGDTNPQVRVGVVNSGGGGEKWFTVGTPADAEYIPRFGWVRDGLIYIQVLNRAQNKLDLYFVDVHSGRSRRMLSETEPHAWVPVNDDFTVLKSGDRFLWTSWRDGHNHIYLYSLDKKDPLASDAKLEAQLTRGNFDVAAIEGVDESTATVFFSGNTLTTTTFGETVFDPRVRSVNAIPLTSAAQAGDSTGRVLRSECSGAWNSATFAPDAKHYVINYSSAMRPPVLGLTAVQADGAPPAPCRPFWESRSTAQFNLIAPKFVEFKAADGVTPLYGELLMPREATIAARGGKAPLILSPYGGPGAQMVRDTWGGAIFLFHQVLARQGYAILQVDNRGTSGRGKEFGAAVMGKFGEVPLADQFAALDQALTAYPALDRNRIGWWGWSYGGYMTLYAMTHSDRIQAGVAVAPVSDWRDYDSIYTERFMGLPREQESAYRNSSPLHVADKLSGRLLIAHGTGDDNVHLQNTIQMVNNLINAGKQFDLQLYPRKTHSIAGAVARTHLFHRIQQHFETYLLLRPN
ncbi:MAG: DPP IV N-terminal domain-containing protein [Terriglobales bacterium]